MARGDDLRQRHLMRLERRIEKLERRSRAFSRGRLVFVIAGGLIVFWTFRAFDGGTGMLALVLAVAGFTVLVKLHDRVDEGLRQTRLLRRIKEIHARRRMLDWDALPRAAIPDRADPYAADLNIVGDRSLHHLLDACGSTGGSTRLREWLVDPTPSLDRVLARQRLVRQLVPLRLFRDHLTRLTLTGVPEGGARWDDSGLRQWLGRTGVIPRLKPWLIGLSAFAAVNVGLIVAHIAGWLPPIWAASLLIYFAVYFTQHRSVKHLFDEAQELDLTLDRVMPPLLFIERFRFASGSEAAGVAGPVQGRQTEGDTAGTPAGDGPVEADRHTVTPSTSMRRVRRIAAGAALTRSEVLWLVLNVLMPWDLLVTYLLHRETASIRDRMPAWLDTWYTLEAASSLAAYADGHPNRTFPTIRSGDGSGPVFQGRALGHPLIREEVKVRNDFSAERLGGVFLITGSNMSGKSTFLRTLGVNLRLAYAGGAVDAAALDTIPFRVLTSINVVDSIQEGLSHFYAEVRRLKELLDALDGPLPLFVLIDEIFRGTNNRERLIGSRAYVRALAGHDAVSLVSTHDLELTQLEGEIDELRNFHFREDVSNGRMTFDYRLRPGPSPTTNALKIMKAAGLPVAFESGHGASSFGPTSSLDRPPTSGPKSSS